MGRLWMMVADSNEIEDSQVSPQAAARLVSAARLRARQADFDDAVDELMVLLLLLFDDLKVERPDCGNMRSGMVCSQLHGERTLVSVACLAVASLTRKLKLQGAKRYVRYHGNRVERRRRRW